MVIGHLLEFFIGFVGEGLKALRYWNYFDRNIELVITDSLDIFQERYKFNKEFKDIKFMCMIIKGANFERKLIQQVLSFLFSI